MKYPIANDCLKVSIGGHYEPKLVSKLLLQVSVRELHNNMVSPQEEGVIREAIYAKNNTLISDYTLYTILTPRLKNMSAR